MTQRDLIRTLRRFWPLSLAVLVLVIAIGAAFSTLTPKRYQANALVYAEPTSTQALAQGGTVVTLIMPALIQQVETQQFKSEVTRIAPQAANATLSASNVSGTPVLTVTAESANRHAVARVANAAVQVLEARVITSAVKLSTLSPATTPSSPSGPGTAPIVLGCLVLGLILGLFAALIADATRKRVAGARMVRDEFGLTVLGEITRNRHVRRPPAALFGDEGSSLIVEECERLRTNFELSAGEHRTVAITSWAEGEGKTTIAADLAWSLASIGRQVTLVDFDLRRPSLHDRFGLELSGGIGDLMANTPSGTPATPKPTGLPSLTVLTAGAQVDHPARVIEKVLPTVAKAFANRRLVLIDTPPLLAAETALVASLVDALIIVIDVRRRDPSDLEGMLQVLKLTQTEVLGVVLNRVRRADLERGTPGYYYGSGRKGRARPPVPGNRLVLTRERTPAPPTDGQEAG